MPNNIIINDVPKGIIKFSFRLSDCANYTKSSFRDSNRNIEIPVMVQINGWMK